MVAHWPKKARLRQYNGHNKPLGMTLREHISMDYVTTDLVLAIVHHLLVFMLAGILAFEIGTVSLTMRRDEILRVGRVDNWYGILAGVVIVVGFIRATVAAKGWAYYAVNIFFWSKIATFLVVALLSIVPTVAIIRWRNALKSDAAFCSAGGRYRSRPRLPLGGGGPVPLAPGVRCRHGTWLWRGDAVMP
jgi:putative membrane protein